MEVTMTQPTMTTVPLAQLINYAFTALATTAVDKTTATTTAATTAVVTTAATNALVG